MNVWRDVVGQDAAIHQLTRATRPDGNLAHAWIIAGPPGSGRSTAARAFAATLQCTTAARGEPGCGECTSCRTTLAGSHGDLTIVRTDTLSIQKDEVRSLVATAQRSPATGRFRLIIIEDADRMSTGTFNVLLKAIEEPPPRTLWMLCVPSAEDLAPTIRSRCRVITLQVPPAAAVAELLVRRDGIDPALAARAAAAAQGHIGIARRYGTLPGSLDEREASARDLLRLTSVGSAVLYAQQLLDRASEEAKREADEVSAAARASFLRGAGLEESARIPPQLRAQVRALDEEAKKRATRLVRDVVDRYLLDIHSVFRDVLTVQLGTGAPLVNAGLEAELRERAARSRPETTLEHLEAVGTARERIGQNVPPLLALEALLGAAALD